MTPEIKQQRKGMFTGSEVHRLMAGAGGYESCEWSDNEPMYEKRKTESGEFSYVVVTEKPKNKNVYRFNDKFLPDGAITYIYEKLGETLDNYDKPDGFENHSTRWGKETEWQAIEAYEQRNECILSHTGENQMFFGNDDYGATPDGVLYDENFLPVRVVDTKCPQAHTHIFNILNVKTVQDLKKHYPEYYFQGLLQILCVGCDYFDWVSFRPTMPEHLQYLQITISAIEAAADIELLKHRLKLAIERKKEYLELLKVI